MSEKNQATFTYLDSLICNWCGRDYQLNNYRCDKTKLTFVICSDCMNEHENEIENEIENNEEE